VFQTKAELARALLAEAKACGVQHACVTCDADYGDKPNFLTGLAARRDCHVVAVRANFSVTLGRRADRPVRRAEDVLAAQPLQDWQTLTWRAGAKGGWRAQFRARRGWRVAGEGTRHVGWLSGQRPGRGQQGDWKYFWRDFPATPPLAGMVEYAHRRHGGEQSQEEAKTDLGWDQYQGRRWEGFPRPALTVMLSYSCLVWLAGRERAQRPGSGRPRAAFSPSPGPPPHAAAGGPSLGERPVAPSRHPRIDRVRCKSYNLI
jgi:SRSO17 transposase